MKASRQTYLGVAVVAIVLLLTVVIGGRISMWAIDRYAYGLAAATGALGLVLYRERRDPALLLVGVGASAYVITSLVPRLVISYAPMPLQTGWWVDLLELGWVIGLVALVANLAFVVPWRERRGRAPLSARRVIAATAGLIVALAALVAIAPRPEITQVTGNMTRTLLELGVAWSLIMIALTVGGLVVTVHSLSWSGRSGWIAAAGLATAAVGGSLYPSYSAAGATWIWVWIVVGPTLAVSSLLVFVLASLRLESSRLRRATDRAAEVMEGRAEVAATIAHDVRGPVGTIKSLATTTRKSYDKLDDEQRLEFVGMIESESERLLRLVDQVAVGLKVDAATLDLSPRSQEVAPLIGLALRELPGAERVEVDAPPDVVAEVDPRWFVEAIRQGLDNALGFSSADAPVTLTVRKAPDDGALITIVDHGPGVDEDRREAVFERFSRWRPAGFEDRQGSGLGLFICRGIARAHGGDATLDAAPEGGTMLRIRFPREAQG